MVLKAIKKVRAKFKRVYLTMFKHYFVFFIIMVMILTLGIGLIVRSIIETTSSKEYIGEVQKYFMASKIVRADYKNIDMGKIGALGGWVEILDSDKKLIYVLGNKKDEQKSYSEEDLIYLVDQSYDKLKNSGEYYCSVANFKADEKKYYCIVKVPAEAMDITVDIKSTDEKYIEKIALKMVGSFILVILLIFLSVFLYAFWTSRKIVKPLRKILEGIKKMTEGDYSTRISFKADNEFAEIKDAFNFMAEKIETSERERERVEKLKQQLLVDISHDIKTPATSIQGYSKALYDGVVPEEKKQKRYLKIIYDKSQRVTALIDNLHELTKLDNQAYVICREKQDFCEFTREILAGFYKEIEDKGFQLEVEIPEREIIYEFDKIEMSRAVSNIIANSLKYNPDKTKMKIELSKNKDGIEFIIADDGIGIDEELKEQIFEPFTRGDSSRRSTGGTGLGLSIAKKIIEKHGGRLTINQHPGYKTCFKIELFSDKG